VSKKIFHVALFLIFAASLTLHLYAIKNGNFFFTADQGRDAVYVREILTHGKIFLEGPETSVRGIFTGPLWYYFIAAGYLVLGGHPAGGIVVLTILNLLLTFWLAKWIAEFSSKIFALILAFSLQIFWPFFQTSLWAFNPFPLVFLAIILLIFLDEFLAGRKKFYFLALIPIFLAFNCEVAGAAAFLIFYSTVGLWSTLKGKIKTKEFLFANILAPLVPGVIFLKQFLNIFIKTKVVSFENSGLGVLAGTNIKGVFYGFARIIGETAFPQNYILGLTIFAIILFLYFRKHNSKTSPPTTFINLTGTLLLVSFVFFASNRGWRAWQTVYLPEVILISLLLMLYTLPKNLKRLFLTTVIFANALSFIVQYRNYIAPSDSPGLFSNQEKAVDWIYQKSNRLGFAVYNYTDAFYDYPYQYLFWWYGLNKYGYLPCEYSNFPFSHKEVYVPGYANYLNPKRACERQKYLIVQSKTNGEKNEGWIEKFRSYVNLVDSKSIGDIKVEKYLTKPNSPSDLCIWLGECK
jgi:hypothetical protein